MKVRLGNVYKKILSTILALAVIVTSISTTLSVFADVQGTPAPQAIEQYAVTYGSPAIPMFKDKELSLSDVKVQFTDGGEFVSGAKITWNNGSKDITKLTPIGTGTTKLTATYNGQSRNVYVVVNDVDDYNFYLVNEDLTAGFDTSKWLFATTSGSNTSTPMTNQLYAISPSTITRGTERMFEYVNYFTAEYNQKNSGSYPYADVNGNNVAKHLLTRGANPDSTHAIFYKSDILKDFADYTVEVDAIFDVKSSAKVGPDADAIKQTKYNHRLGIFARADVDYNAVFCEGTKGGNYFTANETDVEGNPITSAVGANSALALTLRRYSGLQVNKLTSDGTGTFGVT